MTTLRIIGLGSSLYECRPLPEPGVTVWGLQYTWKSHKIDKLIMMDDRGWMTAKNNKLGRDLEEEINALNIPVITSHPWEGLKNNTVYPLDEVRKRFSNLKHKILTKTERGEEVAEVGADYYMNTICYMLALAIDEATFNRIEIFGIDMANMHGRAATETWSEERTGTTYWLGVAVGKGIEVVISRGSRLTKPCDPATPVLYGYEVSEELKAVRARTLEGNLVTEKVLKNATVSRQGGDTIIDMTKTGIKLDFYHKEDMPEGVKSGDTVAPKNQPYERLNHENLDTQ